MTEFKKQVAKEGYQEANAKYMGLAEEPKEGSTKEGNAYRVAKLRFVLDGRQKENKFTIWTPLTSKNSKYKSDAELKQFQSYYIGWYEKDEDVKGQQWVSKTIQVLDDPKEGIQTQNKAQEATKDQVIVQNPISAKYAFLEVLSDFTEFQKIYIEKCPKELVRLQHIVGTYITQKHPKEFEKLINMCKQTIDAMQQPPKPEVPK